MGLHDIMLITESDIWWSISQCQGLGSKATERWEFIGGSKEQDDQRELLRERKQRVKPKPKAVEIHLVVGSRRITREKQDKKQIQVFV